MSGTLGVERSRNDETGSAARWPSSLSFHRHRHRHTEARGARRPPPVGSCVIHYEASGSFYLHYLCYMKIHLLVLNQFHQSLPDREKYCFGQARATGTCLSPLHAAVPDPCQTWPELQVPQCQANCSPSCLWITNYQSQL